MFYPDLLLFILNAIGLFTAYSKFLWIIGVAYPTVFNFFNVSWLLPGFSFDTFILRFYYYLIKFIISRFVDRHLGVALGVDVVNFIGFYTFKFVSKNFFYYSALFSIEG